jgi:hypothetical protein
MPKMEHQAVVTLRKFQKKGMPAVSLHIQYLDWTPVLTHLNADVLGNFNFE